MSGRKTIQQLCNLCSFVCHSLFLHTLISDYKFSYGVIMGKPIGNPPLNLTETQIRYAMENTFSNSSAAKFLNVCYNTYLKYAEQYIDGETGLNLRELHKQKVKPKSEKISNQDRRRYDNGYKEKLEDILAGLYPDYQPRPLRKRLLNSGILPMECSSCGWNECRVTDSNYPFWLAFHDNNWRNKRLENIYLLCFNCYFLQIGSMGQYFQGMTYGTRSKPRGDGRPKGWNMRNYNRGWKNLKNKNPDENSG